MALLKRIQPLNPWEPQEIGIRGVNCCAEFNRKRGEVGIRRQIASLSLGTKKVKEKFSVPRSRIDALYDSAVQP